MRYVGIARSLDEKPNITYRHAAGHGPTNSGVRRLWPKIRRLCYTLARISDQRYVVDSGDMYST